MAASQRATSPADRAADSKLGKRRRDEEYDARDSMKGREDRKRPKENGARKEERSGQKRKSDAMDDERSSKRRRSIDGDTGRKPDSTYGRGEAPPTGPRAQRGGRGGGGGGGGGGHGGGRHGESRNEYARGERRGHGVSNKGDESHDPPKSSNPVTRLSAAWIPDIEVDSDDEYLLEVQKTMGFAGFKSTRERKVPGNHKNHGLKKEKQTQYRQYMNRVGGFNRPLSPPKD